MSGEIAELALASPSLGGFEGRLLPLLAGWLGFDLACSVWSGFDGEVRHVSALEYSRRQLELEFPGYMGELDAAELARFSAALPAVDSDVVVPARRDRLVVYREFLRPMGVSSFVTNIWRSPAGCIGFHFARTGRGRIFGARDLERLRGVVPAMKLAQSLLATEDLAREHQGGSADTGGSVGGADHWALSAREREIAHLVVRGFRNAEIAMFLHLSPNTVRNHLAAVFRKADVSTRAELAFALASPDGARLPGVDPRHRGDTRARHAWSAYLGQSRAR